MRSFLIPLFILLTSCAGDPYVHGDWNGTVCVAPEFTADEETLIFKAAQEWGQRSNGAVDLEVDFLINHNINNCSALISKKDLSQTPDDPNGITTAPIGGQASYTVYINLNTSLSELDTSSESTIFYSVSLHEIGHYLGASHSPWCGDIMYWEYTQVFHLTDRDVNQLWDPYPDHKYDKLSYCQESLTPSIQE